MVTYDIVTVVFESEVSMLELQAISTRRLAHDVGKIIIINNASTPDLVAIVNDKIQNEVIPRYGELADRVELHTVIELLGSCYDRQDFGWESQQLLKLMSSRFVESPLTMILDAKDFFMAHCNSEELIVDQKIKRNTVKFLEWSRNYLENACTILQLNELQQQDVFINYKEIFTPFVIWSDTFKSCINDVCELSNKPLQEIFTINPLLTFEFYLLEAYIAKHYGMNNYFHNEAMIKLFRIHRVEYKQMSEERKIAEANAWVEHGIFDTVEQSINQINKIQKNISDYPRANDSLI